jgi:hypothetical protein
MSDFSEFRNSDKQNLNLEKNSVALGHDSFNQFGGMKPAVP